MKSKHLILFGIILYASLFLLGASFGVTNFDRLVLGEGNFGTDPNTTADLTFQNDEYISNETNGTLDIGSANFTMTGDMTGLDSVSTTKLYAGSSFSVGSNVGAADTFGVTWASNNQELMDTVTVTNGLTTSVYLVSIKKASAPVAGDLIGWAAIAGKLVVYRVDTTTSNLGYSWIKIK